MPVRIVADGTQVYGTFAVSIGGNSYIIENLTVNRNTVKVTDQTTSGLPNRHRETADVFEWTGTLQMTVAAQYPIFGQTFVLTVDNNYGAETFCCRPPTTQLENQAGAIRKIPFTGWIVLNTGQLTTANS